MSFTGDLEHLSIVDVVQLLHATRKSGTLHVSGRKGTVQLVFSDGFIVSANHFDERLKIGAILVEAGVLSREELEQALADQKTAGDKRRPLIATLIESGRVKKENAFHALESLIELTIVDILTWKAGSFTLDVGEVSVADEYRYFPEKLQENVQFHTENVLMEALRIFDEKKRDGRIAEAEPEAPAQPAAAPAAARKRKVELPTDLVAEVAAEMAAESAGDAVPLTEEAELTLSPDDLGLDDVERLERKIPGVFTPFEDRPSVSVHVAAVRDHAPELSQGERDALAAFLDELPRHPAGHATLPLAVIVLGADSLLSHCLATVCRQEGLSVFSTTDPGDVAFVAEQHRNKGGVPVLVLDREGAARYGIPPARHPHLGTVELAAGAQGPAPDGGICTVLQRPSREHRTPSFVPDFIRFLESFPAALRAHAREQGTWASTAARRCALRLRSAEDAQAVVEAVLASLVEIGARAQALVVRGEELATSGGLHTPGADPAPVPALRLPLGQVPVLREAVGKARCVIAPDGDQGVRDLLHPAIGAPAEQLAMILPLAASGKTVSLLYADFGAAAAAPPPGDLLELFAALAGAALELVLCRKRLDKAAR